MYDNERAQVLEHKWSARKKIKSERKSVQAAQSATRKTRHKSLTINNLPRMDSNHDKVIQSRFVRLRKRPRVFAALGNGPIRATFHTVVRFRVVELARTGGYTQMQQDFRYHRSKFTQEQPRPYAVEGIAAISGTKRDRRRPDYWRIE
jgi:hypothetical protein